MKARIQAVVAGLATALCATCGHDTSTELNTHGAIQYPLKELNSRVPIPLHSPDARQSAWDRPLVDLMVADSLAVCSFLEGRSQPINHKLVEPGDEYLDILLSQMAQTMSGWLTEQDAGSPSVQQDWIGFRNDSVYNRSRTTDEKTGAGLVRRDLSHYTLEVSDSRYSPAQEQASESAALAGMNACIAQTLRTMSLGGDTLLLSEAEQLQALEVVRERAQIAMLQYAALFNAMAKPSGSLFDPAAITSYHHVAYLQEWATTEPRRADYFDAWVGDFAASLQLHLAATSELAELFVRSANARSTRGGRSVDAVDEQWGPGSWRQRLLALLYGGDPLAVEPDGSTPWSNILARTAPGATLDSAVGNGQPWPAFEELPYSRVDNQDPRVFDLFSLARRLDVMRVKNDADGSADIAATADRLYCAVEAGLRTEQCAELIDGQCRVFSEADIPSPFHTSTPVEQYSLFRSFLITPDHALTVARILDERTSMSAMAPLSFVGAMRLTDEQSGTWRIVPRDAQEAPRSLAQIAPLFGRNAAYRIPEDAEPDVERCHIETTPNGTTYRVGDDQGLAAGGIYAEGMRVFGAIPAFTLVSQVLHRIRECTTTPDELEAALLLPGDPLEDSIAAAIGRQRVRAFPAELTRLYDWAGTHTSLAGARTVTERLQKTTLDYGATLRVLAGWVVEADFLPGHSFRDEDSSISYDVVAVQDEPFAYALASSPTAQRLADATTIEQLLADGTRTTIASATLNSGTLRAELFLESRPDTAGQQPLTWTLIARRTQGSDVKYLPLTGPLGLTTWQFNRHANDRGGEISPVFSYHFAEGGRLGRAAIQAWTTQYTNPSKPAYDGFGLPYSWVPLQDASIFGSPEGESVMMHFLRDAKSAARDATDAVRSAIESSFKNDAVTLEQEAVRARSDMVLRQSRERFCGASHAEDDCTPSFEAVDLSGTWNPMVEFWPTDVTKHTAYCKGLSALPRYDNRSYLDIDCLAHLLAMRTSELPVAAPVAQRIHNATPPLFSEYYGGQLQSVLIQQWGYLKQISNLLFEIENTKRGAAERLNAADSTTKQMAQLLAAAEEEVAGLSAEQQHIKTKLVYATKAARAQCLAVHDTLASMGEFITFHKCERGFLSIRCVTDYKKYDSGSSIPLDDLEDATIDMAEEFIAGTSREGGYEQLRFAEAACANARVALEEARREAENHEVLEAIAEHHADAADWALEAAKGTTLAQGFEAFGALLRLGGQLDSALAELAKTVAELAQLSQEVRLAEARETLEGAIAARTHELSLGLTRQYHHFDWWRARALLDGARRYAVAARRAIEAHYVVDLDTLTAPEPFVAAPFTWANDIYRYDLSLPSAVGFSVGDTVEGASYPNQVLDYVGNLERFVNGFGVERPVAQASDTTVIGFPGPAATLNNRTVVDPQRAMWAALCPADATCTSPSQPGWCPLASELQLETTCESVVAQPDGSPQYLSPLRIRARFRLDAWGQPLSTDGTRRRFERRVNGRWGRLAVNLVGRVRDCKGVEDQLACQVEPSVFFNLFHHGPMPITGASRQLRLLDIPAAAVEMGRAITVHQHFGLAGLSWGDPRVERIARREFAGRPLAGTYVLEFEGDAAVNLANIEKVEILFDMSYWVLQQ